MNGVFIYLATFFVAVIAGGLIIPRLRQFKIGQIVRDDGPKSHLIKQGTPTMGGVIFICVTFVFGLVYFFMTFDFRILYTILFLVLFGAIGFLDDYLKIVKKSKDGLNAKHKMIGLLIVSILFCVIGYIFGFIDGQLAIPFLGYGYYWNIGVGILFLGVLVLISTTNTVNLSDGVDGLAGTITSVVIVGFILITHLKEDWRYLEVISTILVGSISGFLLFNYHKARVFMGDTGSLALGGFVGMLALLTKSTLVLPVIGLVYVIEALSVTIQVIYFKKTKKRFFKMSPIHHHFELSGFSENMIVAMFSLFTVVFTLIGLILLGIRPF